MVLGRNLPRTPQLSNLKSNQAPGSVRRGHLYPDLAFKALDAYITAHIPFLPEGRFFGLADALSIIRSRYFEFKHEVSHLLSLSPRDFEFLIAALFHKQGFEVNVTKETRDGGADIIAKRSESGLKETVLIECKLYTNPIGVKQVRELYGCVESSRANRGIFVTTSRYTKEAKSFSTKSRIELISWLELRNLLNQYLGTNWNYNIYSHIYERKNSTPL